MVRTIAGRGTCQWGDGPDYREGRVLADEAELPRLDDRLELGVDRQLAAHAADVRPDGRVADPHPGRDLAARVTLGHQAQDLSLPRRQPVQLSLDRTALGQQRGDGAWGDQ